MCLSYDVVLLIVRTNSNEMNRNCIPCRFCSRVVCCRSGLGWVRYLLFRIGVGIGCFVRCFDDVDVGHVRLNVDYDVGYVR